MNKMRPRVVLVMLLVHLVQVYSQQQDLVYFYYNTTIPSNAKVECGVAPLAGGEKIFGGENAKFGAWPWQIAIMNERNSLCGATLIGEEWAITATTCLEDQNIGKLYMRLGEHNLDSSDEPQPQVQLKIREVIKHPNLGNANAERECDGNAVMFPFNDISLIRLEYPIEFKDNIRPLCLPTDETGSLAGHNAVATGWGKTESEEEPGVLKQVTVSIKSNDECLDAFKEEKYNDSYTTYWITQWAFCSDLKVPYVQMCAGYKIGQRDTCKGDEGGPLQVRGKDGKWFLAGVQTKKPYKKCGEPNYFGGYTRVSQYLDWIRSNALHRAS